MVISGSYTCAFGGPVVDVCSAQIPAQPAGTVVKYIISAWHEGGGAEIFANSGEFMSPFTTSGQATVFTYTVAAVITTQPASQTVALTSNVTFSVTAPGTAPLAYQWFFNGAGIVGGTNSSLTVSNASFANAGNYQVIVTNAYSSVTSSVASLTLATLAVDFNQNSSPTLPGFSTLKIIGNPPSIASNYPASTTTSSGNIKLTVTGVGSALDSRDRGTPVNSGGFTYGALYQDFFTANGLNIAFTGLHSNTYYTVTFYDLDGLDGTTVNRQDFITNTTAGFKPLPIGGSTPLTSLSISSNSQYALSLTAVSDAAGNLSFSETGSGGVRLNGLVLAYTTPAPLLVATVSNQTVVLSSNATFTATVSGVSPLAYQWYLNGTTIAGATGSSFTVTNASYANAGGNYSVVVTNAYGAITSSVASLGVIEIVRNMSGADGTNIFAGMVQASDGNIYGTAANGGANGVGTLFRLTPGGVFNTLFAFTGTSGANVGAYPYGRLIQGSDGLLYGTTYGGGANSRGSIYKYSTNGTFTSWYSFTVASGSYVFAGLMQANDGNFYGTTWKSGTSDLGTVYKMTTGGAFTTIWSFSGATGFQPHASLAQGPDGWLYGTCQSGGPGFSTADTGYGSCFALPTTASQLNSSAFTGTNGSNPSGALALGNDGVFYGTTENGGANSFGSVFKVGQMLSPKVSLASFGGTNGSNPTADLLLAPDGSFYGTTQNGGANNLGTVFRLTTNGVITVMLHFNGTQGSHPKSGLLLANDGYLYGTTWDGGTNNGGVVYRFRYAPIFATQPQNVAVECGVTTNLFTFASGYPTISYQWQRAGTNLIGATNSSYAFTASPTVAGAYTVVAANAFGSITSSVANVTLRDTTPPQIVSAPGNQSVGANTNCQFILPDFRGGVVATDCSGNVTIVQSPASGTVIGLGASNITLTATDVSNNLASVIFTINVADTNPPVVISIPTNRVIVASTNCTFIMPDLSGEVVATDCSGVTVTQFDPEPGTVLYAQPWEVSFVVRDGLFNQRMLNRVTTITPMDVTPPTVTASPTNRIITADASCQATVPDLRGQFIATDCPSSLVSINQSPASGTAIGLGITVVTMTATDDSLNATNRTVQLIVADVISPVLVIIPTNQTIAADANCMAAIPILTNSVVATDCGGNVTVSQLPLPGTVIGFGATNVTVMVMDSANNSTNVTVTVTVRDVTPPIISTCATNRSIALGNFATTTLPDLRGQIVATDCGGSVTVSQSPAPGTTIGVGTNTVTLYAADPSGNTNTCTAFVIGVATPPNILVPPGSFNVASGGNATFSVGSLGTPPFSYQWQFNGVNIPGANSQSYNLSNVNATNGGSYTVVVCNAAGCVTSSAGSLTVVDLDIHPVVHIAGPVGATYRVDYSEDLGSPTNWITITNVVLPFSPYLFPDPTPARQVQRFYRAVKQ